MNKETIQVPSHTLVLLFLVGMFAIIRRLFSTAVVLRDYQKKCIEVTLKFLFYDEIKRQAVSLPVGAGKTVGSQERERPSVTTHRHTLF